MIVKRFTTEDIKDITCTEDFFQAIGLDIEEFRNKNIFGNRATYRNMFVSPKTNNNVLEAMNSNVDKVAERAGSKTRARVMISIDWGNFAPISNGPRYDEFEENMGRIIENALYILTPEDDMFEEATNG